MKKVFKFTIALFTLAILIISCSSKESKVELEKIPNSPTPLLVNLNDLISDFTFEDNVSGDKFSLILKNNSQNRISNLHIVVKNNETNIQNEFTTSTIRPLTECTINSSGPINNNLIKGNTTLTIPTFEYRIINEDDSGYIYTQVKYSKDGGYSLSSVNNSANGKDAYEHLVKENKINQERLELLKGYWSHVPEADDKNLALTSLQKESTDKVHEILKGELTELNSSFIGNNIKVSVDVMPLFKLDDSHLIDIRNTIADIAQNVGLLKTSTDNSFTLNKLTIVISQTPQNIHTYTFTLGEGWK